MSNSQEANRVLLGTLTVTLDYCGRRALVMREYMKWCARMTRTTGKRFPRG